MRIEHRRLVRCLGGLLAGLLIAGNVRGADSDTASSSISAMKKLSFEELMDLEVTSVSKHPEKLSESASAIQAISGADIHRSAATNIPDALRLMPNARVAQLTSYAWIITARGFSALFSNKQLALIDGRTIYTPLFAGVFWDVQNVLLEDVDRIEVVSGPGGTLWGANAVNGVINITTKSARDTQGLYLSGGVGSFLENSEGARYGGKVGNNLYYRVYGQNFRRGPMVLANGADAPDAWRMTSGGARLDWFPSKTDTLTLQGDLYSGREHTTPGETTMNGHNVLGRWTRAVAPDSEASLQFYYDRTRRDTPPNALTDKLQTYDLDFQHRFPTGERSLIVWGAGYRNLRSAALHSTPRIAFLPRVRDMDLFSGFLQDELSLVPERLKLILGSKLEHNVYSGFEVQPTARIAWTPDRQQMTWAAISRAVRSPSRIDVDYHIPGVDIEPGTPGVDGGPDFDSEKVIAYELGYRVQPAAAVALSLAAFYNRYDDIYSVEALPGTPTYRIQNGTEGHSWGAELSGSWQIAPWWRVRGGASLFRKHLWSKPGHSFDPASLGNDPERQWVLHSMMELPGRLQLDLTARYVGALPNPVVPNYLVADVRVAWQVADWEFSVIGQNLGDKQHPEFSAQSQVPRAVHGRVTFRW